MRKQYLFGGIISYASIFINIIASLLYIPWMVREIGQSNYALYTLSTSFISIFLMDFGLSSAVSRFVAKYRAENNTEKINAFIKLVTKMYVAIDIFIFFILFIIYFFINDIYVGLTSSELAIYKTLYIVVASYSILSFPFLSLSGVLNAYEKFVELKLCELGQRLVTIFLVILALINGYGVIAIVSANAISSLMFILIKLLLVNKLTKIKLKIKTMNKFMLKEILSFSVWVTIMSISQRFIFNLAPSILGIVSTSSEIAVFSPANSLEGYFFTFAAAVNGMFLSKISRHIAKKEEDKIFFLMLKVGRYQLVILGLVFIGFICVGKDFILLWMGKSYAKSWECTILLFIPDILIFTEQIASTTMIAKNYVKEMSIGYVIMALICFSLSFPLSANFGAIGACISIAISYLFIYIYLNFLYSKKLNISISKFIKYCFSKYIILALICIPICYILCNKMININGWIGLLIKGVVIIVIYFCLVRIIYLDKEEKNCLKIFWNKLCSKFN